jgi:hypothetical protein
MVPDHRRRIGHYPGYRLGRTAGPLLCPRNSGLAFGERYLPARLARTVVAGLPHHATQRGNRRETIFFEDGDQEVYQDLLAGRFGTGSCEEIDIGSSLLMRL